MSSIVIILKNIIKRMFKTPLSLLFHFLLPTGVSIGLFLLLSISGESIINVALVDLDRSEFSKYIIENVKKSEGFRLTYISEKEINEYLISNNASFGFVIPEDFQQTILNNKKPNIKVVSKYSNRSTELIESILNFNVTNLVSIAEAGEFQIENTMNLIKDIKGSEFKLKKIEIDDTSKEKATIVRTIGMYMLFILITTFSISYKILNEKHNGTFGRIGMSPVHPKTYAIANVLANLLVSMIQIAIVMIALKVVINIDYSGNALVIYFLLVIFSMCAISVGLLFAAISKNINTANALMAMVISPSCMIASCFWPIEFMPKFMQKIAFITPQRWILDAIEKYQVNNNFVAIIPNILIVFSFTLLFFLMAVYKFKNEDNATS